LGWARLGWGEGFGPRVEGKMKRFSNFLFSILMNYNQIRTSSK
jgi:hypothetical protein